MNKPQPQILIIWRSYLALASILPAFLISLLFRAGTLWWTISAGIFVLLFLFMYLVYFPLLYKKMTFHISDGNLIVITGVFYTRSISMPVSQVQFVTVSKSVLGRFFGLSSVTAVAAGGRLSVFGLKNKDAAKLANVLNPKSL